MFERYLKDPEGDSLGHLLQCPVSLTLMRDPVVLIPSGITVEKGVAERLQGTCPVTRVPITGTVKNYALKAISDAFFQGKFASWDNREVVLAHIEDGVDKLRVIESLENHCYDLEEKFHEAVELAEDFKSKIRILQARIKTVESMQRDVEDMNKTLEFDVRRACDRAVSFEMRIRVLEAMNADEREARVEQNYAALNQAEEFKSKIRILQATIADERQARINQEDEARMYREQAEHFEAEMQRYEPIVTPAPEESLSDGPVIQPGPARMVAIIESPIADGPALYDEGPGQIRNQYGRLEKCGGSMRLFTEAGKAFLHNSHPAQPITVYGPWVLVPITSHHTRGDVVRDCQQFLSEADRLADSGC